MKRVFGDEEFTRGGEPLVLTKEYKVGVQAMIPDDPDNYQGILLRKYLYSFVDPDLPAVFPGDRMEIIEGPVPGHRIIGGWGSKGEPYWKVRIIYQDWRSYKLVGNLYLQEGWIPEALLGEIIQQSR